MFIDLIYVTKPRFGRITEVQIARSHGRVVVIDRCAIFSTEWIMRILVVSPDL